MITTLVLVFLSLFLGTAHAGDREAMLNQIFPTLIPPAEYDHPFQGVVMITRLDRAALIKRCVLPNAWGCAHHNGPSCEVTIGIDEMLVTTTGIRVPWQDIYRHEIAHCNGWPAHHPMIPRVAREELPPLTVMPIPTKPVPVPVIRIDGAGISSADFRHLMTEYAARRARELGLQ
jgi:hypothetical protein